MTALRRAWATARLEWAASARAAEHWWLRPSRPARVVETAGALAGVVAGRWLMGWRRGLADARKVPAPRGPVD